MVFFGLQKDRELYNVSLSPPLPRSHSVIKSSLMVLFFRVSAFWSLFFSHKFSCGSNRVHHCSLKPHRAGPWPYLCPCLSSLTAPTTVRVGTQCMFVEGMISTSKLEITHSWQLREFQRGTERVYKQWNNRKSRGKSRKEKKSSWGSRKRLLKLIERQSWP